MCTVRGAEKLGCVVCTVRGAEKLRSACYCLKMFFLHDGLFGNCSLCTDCKNSRVRHNIALDEGSIHSKPALFDTFKCKC